LSLESSKALSGVGAILVAIGSFVPALAIVGIILVLIGMKGLSDAYGEKAIFQNALYGFIFEVVASAAFFFIFVGTLLRGLTVFRPIEFLAGFGLALVLAFIFFVLAAYFYKKSFDTLSSKSNERLFGTAGLLLLIGAVLTIILVGAFIMLVAWILAAVAFFSLKPPAAN
jgi:uncharacterized membrane protein